MRGTCPGVQAGCGFRTRSRSRSKSRSGQFAANANRIRLPVSRIRTATFNKRRRMVENSPLASGWGTGMVSRIARISQ